MPQQLARAWTCALLIALPFLFPWAAGPSVNTWQLLAAWSCSALLVIVGPAAALAPRLAAWLAFGAAWVLLGRGPGTVPGLSAAAAVGVVGLAACVGAGLARSPKWLAGAFGWGLLIAGLVSAILGLLQYYGMADALAPWTTAPKLGEAYGNLRQRNQFATLIGMALIAALWLYATHGRGVRTALWPAGILLIAAAAASTSRTGLIQVVSISIISAFLAWRERQPLRAGKSDFRLPSPWLLLAIIAVYFFFAWLLPTLAGPEVEGIFGRLREGESDAHGRAVLWHNVLALIARHPWRGWGWGELSYAHYATFYSGPRFMLILDNAHNLPLHLAVELGVPAAVLICGNFGWMMFAARPWRETDSTRLMAWGMLAAILLHSLLEYPLWYGPFQLVFGLCLGLLWPAAEKPRPAWRAIPVLSRGAAVLLLAVVGYTGWDYNRISQIYLARDERLPAYRDDTLAKLQGSWLFARQVQFAELTLTPVDKANAARMHALALQMLHFSPEPRVIIKLIESATLLGRDDEAFAQAARFKDAFPNDYVRWLAGKPLEEPPD
ncbi:putative bicarbonate transporter, IctB family [Variovorax sp. SRS16]|uniref:PglL family O-oligosaccharyltransferase n=1 Tax=Variovorax sp. SRS16 TaxID=282217 RepID=UPI0013181179|nr:Wzy polymerase domain-containing protein [Variovorax sp. SRS16]VTU33968.1 putative bicarbonate transporter, IctB family [Variovorax sp. SRS16]